MNLNKIMNAKKSMHLGNIESLIESNAGQRGHVILISQINGSIMNINKDTKAYADYDGIELEGIEFNENQAISRSDFATLLSSLRNGDVALKDSHSYEMGSTRHRIAHDWDTVFIDSPDFTTPQFLQFDQMIDDDIVYRLLPFTKTSD